MKYRLFLFYVISIWSITLFSCQSLTDRNVSYSGLKFAGVYRCSPSSAPNIDYWYYLRFYRDGRVISVSSTGNPEDIKTWFSAEKSGISSGTYSVDGSKIVFSSEISGYATELGIPSAAVKYQGYILGEELVIDTHSEINGFRSYGQRYKFIPLNFSD